MSKERELLKKILATRWLDHELSCEAEKLLAQPEPLTSRQGLEEYKKGYYQAELDLKREPLRGIEISQGFKADDDATHPYSYWAGINFAEKHHDIGGEK